MTSCLRYKWYIPADLRRSISQRNILTRLRISNVFRVFLQEFSDKTVQRNSVGQNDLKVKYLATLETLTRHFGCELFQPRLLSVHESEEAAPGPAAAEGQARRRVLVSGTRGIRWQDVPAEVSE